MIGQQVSHYRVCQKIGGGGMGVVYRATDTRLGRDVAIKFLPAEFCQDGTARARFEREAQTVSSLNHPHICSLFDLGEYEGQPFLVMELIEGQTLKQRIGGRPLSASTLLELAIQLTDALDAAHGLGIIHRDIKCSNILVDNRDQARLLDFGLAKLAQEPLLTDESGEDPTEQYQAEFRTDPGTVLGTMNFMSPEQARGDELDARSDLFSFGVVLYEMATGRTPFGGKTIAITFDEILNKIPASITSLNASLPAGLDQIVSRCLAKRPENRFGSAAELRDGLIGLKGTPETFRAAVDETGMIPDSVARTVLDSTPSVAVLPLMNLSGNTDNDYFGDGLAEELIGGLMKVEGLRVAARTSAFQFKGQALDVREIGQKLGVTAVLEGSFRMAGERVRISVNLINVSDGYQLWSERFDRDLEDVFTLQDEIARTIVHALEVTFSSQSQSRIVRPETEHVEAYNDYMRGRFHWKARKPDSIHKAIGFFKRALERDPDYAAAHAGLADCYAMLGAYAVLPRQEVMPQARAAAERALQLDEKLPQSHTALGLVEAIHEFQWEEAEKHFLRAIEIAPDDVTARYWYALFVLLPHGRFAEALGQAEWAAELDPTTPSVHVATGLVYFMQARFAEAAECIAAGLELEPDHPLCNITMGWCQSSLGNYAQAQELYHRAKALRITSLGGRAWTHVLAGELVEGRDRLAELGELSERGNSQADFEMARVHVSLGENDQAFDCLERTYNERAGTLFWLKVNPHFQSLADDSRFDALLRKMRL